MGATAAELDAAAGALERGEVVGLPTDTVYGLAARALDAGACGELFRLKRRPEGVALPVLVADLDQAATVVADEVLEPLRRLGEALWPGALTVVVARRPGLGLRLGGDQGSVGVRCPAEELVRDLCRRVGPLATTSANRHGGPPAESAATLRSAFAGELELVVDAGPRQGRPSTVVSLLAAEAQLLREGPVSLADVRQALA